MECRRSSLPRVTRRDAPRPTIEAITRLMLAAGVPTDGPRPEIRDIYAKPAGRCTKSATTLAARGRSRTAEIVAAVYDRRVSRTISGVHRAPLQLQTHFWPLPSITLDAFFDIV